MFNIFGSDNTKKKKELEENMDKIRDMVKDKNPQEIQAQQRDAPQAPQQTASQTGQESQKQSRGETEQQNQQRPPRTKTDTPPSNRQKSNSQNQETQQASPAVPSRSSGQTEKRQQPPQPVKSQEKRRQQEQTETHPDKNEEVAGGSSPSLDDVPEPPETKEIDIPDIQKGPLFIRVRKFKEAKQMVSRMRDLNDDMETQMGGLRNTLQEDQETTRRLNDAMKRLQDSMNTIRDIVSP